MYALSLLVGRLADRLGRIPVLLGGRAVLLAACAVSGLAAPASPAVTVGLVLLGAGWSVGPVSGSALLAESLPPSGAPPSGACPTC